MTSPSSFSRKPPPLPPRHEERASRTRGSPIPPPPAKSPAIRPIANASPEDAVETERHFPKASLTSFGISLVVHIVALLFLALIVVSTNLDNPPRTLDFGRAEDESTDLDYQKLPSVEVMSADELADIADWNMPEEVPIAVPESDVSIDADLLPIEAPARVDIDALLGNGGMQVDGLMADLGAGNSGAGGGSRGGAGGFGGELGRRLAREGAQTGSIQVSLLWNNLNDLDLHVISPTGERIFYGNRQSQCGGKLDVDMNAGRNRSTEPVENIFWPQRTPLSGGFIVYVDYFSQHDPQADATDFEVHVLVDGEKQVFQGKLRDGMDPLLVTTFLREPRRPQNQSEFPE